MATVKNIAIIAAFIQDGVRDAADNFDLLTRWNQGAFELIDSLTDYSEVCCMLADTGGEITGDYPGVYEYEVAGPFGTWFAKQIMGTCDKPSVFECNEKLKALSMEFFRQNRDLDECVFIDLGAAFSFILQSR